MSDMQFISNHAGASASFELSNSKNISTSVSFVAVVNFTNKSALGRMLFQNDHKTL